MKKIILRIMKDDGTVEHVEAEAYNFQWSIHYNEEIKQWVLSHVKSGKRVWIDNSKRTLQLIVNQPEFFEEVDANNPDSIRPIVGAIGRVVKNLDTSKG